jgi:hypothetical protein
MSRIAKPRSLKQVLDFSRAVDQRDRCAGWPARRWPRSGARWEGCRQPQKSWKSRSLRSPVWSCLPAGKPERGVPEHRPLPIGNPSRDERVEKDTSILHHMCGRSTLHAYYQHWSRLNTRSREMPNRYTRSRAPSFAWRSLNLCRASHRVCGSPSLSTTRATARCSPCAERHQRLLTWTISSNANHR